MQEDGASTLTYQATLPLAWSPVTEHGAGRAMRQQSNLALLRALSTLEAQPPGDKEHEVDPHLAKTIERLESKLDIALVMLARLTAQQSDLPVARPITLGVRHLQWVCATGEAPAHGSRQLLALYLSPRLPEPLRIDAEVETRVLEDGRASCLGQFLDRDEEFEEWLIRTLFRYHRRALQSRHSG